MAHDKFMQPVDAIHVISRAGKPRAPMADDALAAATDTIKASKNVRDVATDLEMKGAAREESEDAPPF